MKSVGRKIGKWWKCDGVTVSVSRDRVARNLKKEWNCLTIHLTMHLLANLLDEQEPDMFDRGRNISNQRKVIGTE